jgi:hypothetical protein
MIKGYIKSEVTFIVTRENIILFSLSFACARLHFHALRHQHVRHALCRCNAHRTLQIATDTVTNPLLYTNKQKQTEHTDWDGEITAISG